MPTRRNLKKSTNADISKKDVETAKFEEQIRSIKRHSDISALNDYINFITRKILGLGGLILGSMAALYPNFLPMLKNPGMIAGAGLALLTGKSIITLITKVEKSLGERR